MNILINWLVSAVAIIISSYIIPGVHVADFLTALLVAVVLGIINAIIKPIILLFTLPINIMTLGIFSFIINALLIMLTGAIVKGFTVENFVSALLFSIVLSLVKIVLNTIVK
jgi:putative membrane protein